MLFASPMKLHWIFSFSILVVPQSASGVLGSKPLVLSIMYVREVGKLALYVRKKEWLMILGRMGSISRFDLGVLGTELRVFRKGSLRRRPFFTFFKLLWISLLLCPLQLTIFHELMLTSGTRLFN